MSEPTLHELMKRSPATKDDIERLDRGIAEAFMTMRQEHDAHQKQGQWILKEVKDVESNVRFLVWIAIAAIVVSLVRSCT